MLNGYHGSSAIGRQVLAKLRAALPTAWHANRKSAASLQLRRAKAMKSFVTSSNRCLSKMSWQLAALDRPAWEGTANLLEESHTAHLQPGLQLHSDRIETVIAAGGMGRAF
jgi:hypothetical protein